ncbi:hypothetical protein ACLB1S_24900 [Escherichia coli]
MLERLMALAKEKSLGFGVKLTNTLAPSTIKAHCLVKRCICQAVRCSRSPSMLQQFSLAPLTANCPFLIPVVPVS